MEIIIQSHKGPYTVHFGQEMFQGLRKVSLKKCHVLIDERVADIYENKLKSILSCTSVMRITANESSKTLNCFTNYVEQLVSQGIRRNHRLIAIGGGVIQDITAFLATILFRGVEWDFYPTTLLAQADSCIGSKSSINVGETKNLIGTFRPPQNIFISSSVLKTLDETDLRSGIGEIIKVHIIDSTTKFNEVADNYDQISTNKNMMMHFIRQSLLIKKYFIENDEFDCGVRNVLNYGHSFGHAVEAASDFSIPHGIGVTMGMDMANFVSMKLGRLKQKDFDRMHQTLKKNWCGFERKSIPMNKFLTAINHDKKNEGNMLILILPDSEAIPQKTRVPYDEHFSVLCEEWFKSFKDDI